MGDNEWFQVCSPQVQNRIFHITPIAGSETPHCEDWKQASVSGGVHEFPGWYSQGGALNLIRVVAHLKWGGDRDTLLMLYRAIVRSKFDYGCIVYGTASSSNLRQLDSTRNSGLRLALGAFYTSTVSSLYTEANEDPLEKHRLNLSMHYYLKTSACIDNPAHHVLHEFNRTTRDLYAPRPNGRGGKTRSPTLPLVSK